MEVNRVLDDFVQLGRILRKPDRSLLDDTVAKAKYENPWFTEKSINQAISALAYMLEEEVLKEWFNRYHFKNGAPKNIGVVMAGNIPLVGFHDLLCVLLSGNKAVVKASSQDRTLTHWIVEQLRELNSLYEFTIEIVDKIAKVDAVIATGSDNTARYFEYYFRSIPYILRKNRTSVAVLQGEENPQDLEDLAGDIFTYYGLGCRNVSKLFVPEQYKLEKLAPSFRNHEEVMEFHKYVNNYTYNKAIFSMSNVPMLDFGNILLVESEETVSPIGVCYYERYKNQQDLGEKLQMAEHKIQVVVGNYNLEWVPFGTAQKPRAWDYADNIDTMSFLAGL